MKPMLCRPIDQSTLVRLVAHDEWAIQQKCDGTRLLLQVNAGKAVGYGRNGQKVDLPSVLAQSAPKIFPNGQFVLDGEVLKVTNRDCRFVVFDLIEAGEIIQPSTPFHKRYEVLRHLADVAKWQDSERFTLLKTAFDPYEKVRMVRKLATSGAEGVIARRLEAPYRLGFRSYDVVKYKYVKTVDCIVSRAGDGGRRNFVLELIDDNGERREVGKVSALEGDGPGVRVGSVVTVRYLYATADKRLYQPKYPVLRTDKAPEECTLDQLVFTTRELLA